VAMSKEELERLRDIAGADMIDFIQYLHRYRLLSFEAEKLAVEYSDLRRIKRDG